MNKKATHVLGLLAAWIVLSAAGAWICSLPKAQAMQRFGVGDSLGLSPFWDWKTLETEHFRVTFPSELEVTAQKAANYLEEAHAILSPRFNWTPRTKTQILVIDNSDAANGLTTPVARFGIVLYVTPPESWFSTAYYEDWLRLLAIHEYTHLLNMDATKGPIWETLRFLTGDVLLPNSLWTPWMLEGMAVYMETRYTRAGRGRSPYYEMILRAAAEEKLLNDPRFITLDRLAGDNPYYPAGETPYLFGYQLMNQLARTPPESLPSDPLRPGKSVTADKRTPLADSEDLLGQMSDRSSYRIPFFINGNLENLTGREWKDYWASWVEETRARMEKELAQLRSQPLTPVRRLTENGFGVLGAAVSQDGKRIAYTQDSPDRRQGLYVRSLEEPAQAPRRLEDKSMGVGMAFLPDHRTLIYSSLHRVREYSLWSDLAAIDVESGKKTWLSEGLRAKDPDLSRDGRTVVFAWSQDSTVGLGAAELTREGDHWTLGPTRKLFWPTRYDRVSNPKISPDGKRVAFTLHRNGKTGSELWELELAEDGSARASHARVADGAMNRFPAFDSHGSLFFVSDRTGVDNLYRLRGSAKATLPERVTHVTTGLWLPAFGPEKAYASVFSTRGWDLAEIELAQQGLSRESQVSPPPAPPVAESAPSPSQTYPVQDYSVIPSIWPRQWLPVFLWYPNGVYVGGQASGFDATDRHRYLVGAAVDSQIKKLDWFLGYENRQLGPTLTVLGYDRTTDVQRDTRGSEPLSYFRKTEYSLEVSYPFQATYSVLTPSLSYNSVRYYLFFPSFSKDTPLSKSRYLPNFDLRLDYSDSEASRLAISRERGRNTFVGGRVYLDGPEQTWKATVADTEYLAVTEHSVLIPSVKYSVNSRRNLNNIDANVIVSGNLSTIAGSEDLLDELRLRGYSRRSFFTRSAGILSLDYRAPLLRIFRGWDTYPAFLNNLYGIAFVETAYFPTRPSSSRLLPSAGTGVHLTGEALVRVPVDIGLEYHHGFRKAQGGGEELFLGLNVPAFSF